MPYPRKSRTRHKAAGTLRRDRHGKGPSAPADAVDELGKPPRGLTAGERAAWREIASNAPAGLLGRADRCAVELAARLLEDVRQGDRTAAKAAQLASLLHRLGGTPAARSALDLPTSHEKGPWDEFQR